ncbi:hypothetical protein [Actinoplanes sp. NBRC 103695]|uniref:hypothetical protein n=1 Tax=Actinoplanes sp. NBRC 103695 TaxID=3032202 RepID=UPI0024A22607|nr:hypothetical protein [Actinoplanes sp. NBRC 103695]GLY93223.1 hypothetical protein Acsp02_04790 [Actinoplanes sp. NBRC 103695]
MRNPDGLLRTGGARTVLVRPEPTPPPSRPAGTTATASSFHPPNNGNDGQPRTYGPGNAIDDDPSTCDVDYARDYWRHLVAVLDT